MRHATRLALFLALLGLTAVFEVNDARSESIESSCTVTRNCDYGSPISCTSPSGFCSSGPFNYGWVECDGNRQYCPPPPPPPPCSYPDCGSFDGVTCTTGKTTTCSYASPSGCRNFTCNCSNGFWICP